MNPWVVLFFVLLVGLAAFGAWYFWFRSGEETTAPTPQREQDKVPNSAPGSSPAPAPAPGGGYIADVSTSDQGSGTIDVTIIRPTVVDTDTINVSVLATGTVGAQTSSGDMGTQTVASGTNLYRFTCGTGTYTVTITIKNAAGQQKFIGSFPGIVVPSP